MSNSNRTRKIVDECLPSFTRMSIYVYRQTKASATTQACLLGKCCKFFLKKPQWLECSNVEGDLYLVTRTTVDEWANGQRDRRAIDSQRNIVAHGGSWAVFLLGQTRTRDAIEGCSQRFYGVSFIRLFTRSFRLSQTSLPEYTGCKSSWYVIWFAGFASE